MGQLNFTKPFEFHSFSEIIYCHMIRVRNMNWGVSIKSTRIIFENENMGQSLFSKCSKFQNFDELLYCGMTRLKNVKFGVFR